MRKVGHIKWLSELRCRLIRNVTLVLLEEKYLTLKEKLNLKLILFANIICLKNRCNRAFQCMRYIIKVYHTSKIKLLDYEILRLRLLNVTIHILILLRN